MASDDADSTPHTTRPNRKPSRPAIEQSLNARYTSDGMWCEVPGPGSVGPAALQGSAVALLLSLAVFRAWAPCLFVMAMVLLTLGTEWARRSLESRTVRLDQDRLKVVHDDGNVLIDVNLFTVEAVSVEHFAVRLHRPGADDDERVRTFLGKHELRWLAERIAEAASTVHRARRSLNTPEHAQARKDLERIRATQRTPEDPSSGGPRTP